MDLAVDQLDVAIHRPNINSYKPYPAQLAFHECNLTGRYMSAGNRAGKTTAAVIDCIEMAMNRGTWRKRDPRWGKGSIRLRWVAVDVDKGILGIALPEFKRWMSPSMMVNGSWSDSWNNSTLTLTFSNGSTVQFLTHGMDIDKHGGVALHGIYFDEIPPHAVFNENLMRLVDYEGYWVIAATSVEGMGWTYELLWEPAETYNTRVSSGGSPEPLDGENADVGIFQLSQRDNPYLKTSVSDRGKYYVAMDENERRIREEGDFLARAGRVFPTWNVHDHVLAEHFMPGNNWRFYTSVDFGWTNPTAWLWHAVHPDGRVYTFAEHYKSEMPVSQHAEIVLAKEAFMRLDSSKIIRVGDPNNGNAHVVNGISYVSEYANCGVYIGIENIPRTVEIGIEKMQQYIRLEKHNGWGANKPRWMISPNCVNLIREMKKLRRASYDSSKKAFDMNKKEDVHKKDDHAFDSCFPAGTLVSTSIGEVPIEKVKQGDLVWTRGGLNKVTKSGPTKFVDSLVRIELSSGKVLRGTDNHRIFTNRGWVRLDSLRYSDRVSTWSQNSEPISILEESIVTITRERTKTQLVYDLSVENEHEFFANGVLAHNCRYLFTLMPDLAPSIDDVIEEKREQGIIMDYAQTVAMLRNDDRVEFVDNDGWDTEYLAEFEEV